MNNNNKLKLVPTIVFISAIGAVSGILYYEYNQKQTKSVENISSSSLNSTVKPHVPVTYTHVKTGDFALNISGLGTVSALNTVTARSQVSGQVTKIAFRQGQMMKKGELLAEIDPRPYQAALDQAMAKKSQDEASLQNANLNLQRFSRLATESFESQQGLDAQKSLVAQTTAQIQGDNAAIEAAKTNLSYTQIVAPIDGKAGFRLVDQGNVVQASDNTGIVTIVQLNPISVVFTVSENHVNDINAAMTAGNVEVDALSSDGARVLATGRLEAVDNSVSQATGTLALKAVFNNTANQLWPGQSVIARVHISTLNGVATVPDDVVQHGPNGLFAYVIAPDNTVQVRPIKVSATDSTTAVISEGLSAGETVVVGGQSRLFVGASVDAKPVTPEIEASTGIKTTTGE